MKTLFKKGHILTIERELAPNEEIEILKVYPAGHKYATKGQNFYLVKSSDSGEDVKSETDLFVGLDLFINYKYQPKELKAILKKYEEEENDYETIRNMLSEVEAIGFTFEYYLDAIPFNLTVKITVEDEVSTN